MIIAITLNAVAAVDKRMMNLEKDFCLLKAIRLAISKAKFKCRYLMVVKSTSKCSMEQKQLVYGPRSIIYRLSTMDCV